MPSSSRPLSSGQIRSLALLSFDHLLNHLGVAARSQARRVLPELEDVSCAAFLTWEKCTPEGAVASPAPGELPKPVARHGGWARAALRGCTGTFQPNPVGPLIRQLAIGSAVRDTRFPPVTLAEVPLLRATVSILHSFEPITDKNDWQIGTHGIEIEFLRHGRRVAGATFLPSVMVDHGFSHDDTFDYLVDKAGLRLADFLEAYEHPSAALSVVITRYQTATSSADYAEWLEQC
ncbi:hypothetical protein H696_00166 [Fonticula alba]|uniref:AMMECR1 domain-containing protein n=1 Tax=Fonticula alba TaxID=691883 RepID=A0A058ZDV1_FONAL|nr:hypothetical protein H696_00166 [Fonticula alba]KCV72575.1 hypothetical protein H696_00166 [Fonticula alba]|eukprot:XP_009492276.1 hypothetical protein H696_00166 [Fonticula alba]